MFSQISQLLLLCRLRFPWVGVHHVVTLLTVCKVALCPWSSHMTFCLLLLKGNCAFLKLLSVSFLLVHLHLTAFSLDSSPCRAKNSFFLTSGTTCLRVQQMPKMSTLRLARISQKYYTPVLAAASVYMSSKDVKQYLRCTKKQIPVWL